MNKDRLILFIGGKELGVKFAQNFADLTQEEQEKEIRFACQAILNELEHRAATK